MAYTETKRESWLGRLGNAFKGIIIGGILVLVAIGLLFWNEGWTIERYRDLEEGKANVVSVSSETVVADNEGKLVYMTGEAETDDILSDETFQVSVNAVGLKRCVEMYQWKENSESETEKNVGGGTTTTTTYTYDKVWSSSVIDSSSFQESGHDNPDSMPYQGETWLAEKVTLGTFDLSPSLIAAMGPWEKYEIEPQKTEAVSEGDASAAATENAVTENAVTENAVTEVPTDAVLEDGENTTILRQFHQGGYYIGNHPDSPQIGDTRITFEVVRPKEISLISQQHGNTFIPYQAVHGTLELLENRLASVEEMFANAHSANRFMAWILRLVGVALMFFGLKMILAPLSVLADVLPILGNIVEFGTSVFAFLMALAGSLLTIAIAWFFYRPLIGVPLLVASGGLFVYSFWKARKRKE